MSKLMRVVLACVGLLGAVSAAGCQTELAGMTLPSARYLKDDVQYFPPGPEFPLANEEAALQEQP